MNFNCYYNKLICQTVVIIIFQITNLDALTSNETYKTLRFFYADENKITNITTLEGSYFMYNFAVLSLKLNQLKFVSTIYLLIKKKIY